MAEWSEFLIPDPWLSGILERQVFRLLLPNTSMSWPNDQPDLDSNGFIYTKVPVNEFAYIKKLEALGFFLADTNIQLSKRISTQSVSLKSSPTARWSTPQDREQCVRIASKSFAYSRFHTDSLFSESQANALKAAWVDNFFNQQRGDGLIVAECEGKVAAFLLFLCQGATWCIDLIATDPDYQRKGLGRQLLASFEAWAPEEIQTLKVGTQLINLPSLQLYQQAGFQMCEANYVFHYHQELSQ
jgi:GNAT superfamily N-acetyltransferase